MTRHRCRFADCGRRTSGRRRLADVAKLRRDPVADGIITAGQPVRQVRVEAFHALRRPADAARRARPTVILGHQRVPFSGVTTVGCAKRRRIDGRLSRPYPATALEPGHPSAQVGINQPVAGRHGTAVVEQRGIRDDNRPPVVVRDGHIEGALRRAAQQGGHRIGLSGGQGCAGGATDEQRSRG